MAQPVSTSNPGLQNEVAFLAGVDSSGRISAGSFWTWGQSPGISAAYKWGGDAAGSSGGTVTYAFDAASSWNATEQAWFSAGLSLWSAVANIKFAITTNAASANFVFKRGSDDSAYQDGDLAASSNPNAFRVGGSALAHPTATGTVISIDTSVAGFGPILDLDTYGGYPIMTLLHEQGHMLGLGHGGFYNGSVNPATEQQTAFDTRLWTLMSYIEPATTTAKYAPSYPVTGTSWQGNDPTTWMPLDIVAIQRLYGVAVDTPLSGGQTYGFNCNIQGAIAPFFDFTKNATPVVTVWNKGTGNTLDLSGFSQAATIDLNPGTFSSCAGLTNNIAIAFGTVVETAIGGRGNDRITGTGGDNVLVGGRGADILFGGAGHDVFKDNALNFQGDVIADFSSNDRIWITDANLPSFVFRYENYELSFSLYAGAPAARLSVPSGMAGHFVAQADSLGGVDLVFVNGQGSPSPSPVYRFYDTSTGDHFYTTDAAEKASIQAHLPAFRYEGSTWATPDKDGDTLDVFRFFDSASKTHHFTTSSAERDVILSTLPTFHYEGVAFQSYQDAGAGMITLERFYNSDSRVHHFAASAQESADIRAGLAGHGWIDEGPGFIVHAPVPDFLI
jgi:hypothetical protein